MNLDELNAIAKLMVAPGKGILALGAPDNGCLGLGEVGNVCTVADE